MNVPLVILNNGPEPENGLKPRRKPPLQRGISRNKSDTNILPVNAVGSIKKRKNLKNTNKMDCGFLDPIVLLLNFMDNSELLGFEK